MDLTERSGTNGRRHPWELARAGFFISLLRQHGLLDGSARWLDVGSGDAWLAAQIRNAVADEATFTCWDVNYTSEELESLGAEIEGVRFTAARPAESFDRVLVLDVIEHVEDDEDFVARIVDELVGPGAFVLVSVPAYQSLFSSHDHLLRHHRRYSPSACRRVLVDAGLKIVADGGLFASLLPPRLVQLAGERLGVLKGASSGVGDWRGGSLVTTAVEQGLTLDAKVSLALGERRISVPGLSFWALCRRAT